MPVISFDHKFKRVMGMTLSCGLLFACKHASVVLANQLRNVINHFG